MAAPAMSGLETQFAADVRAGLSKDARKELPSKYLYDALGSTLFDSIRNPVLKLSLPLEIAGPDLREF